MRLVVDLDGTLCDSKGSNYKEARPIAERIERLNSLAEEGCYVTIYTARGMQSSRGIVWLAKLRWYRITKRQLRDWGISHNKLRLGKPAGDLYIDDKAITASTFFN